MKSIVHSITDHVKTVQKANENGLADARVTSSELTGARLGQIFELISLVISPGD